MTLPAWYQSYCVCVEVAASVNFPSLVNMYTGRAQGIVSGAVFAGEIDHAQAEVLHKAAESVCECRLKVLQSNT